MLIWSNIVYKLMSAWIIIIVIQNANEGLDEYPGTRGRLITLVMKSFLCCIWGDVKCDVNNKFGFNDPRNEKFFVL